jgi:type IV secretory pathway VirB6-like protein
MKNVYLVCAITFAFVSCNCQKKALDQSPSAATVSAVNQQNMPKLEYVATTRGFYEKITIENNTVTVSHDRNGVDKGETAQISNSDRNELRIALEKFKLSDLSTFKDPTQKRFYDGAAIATLKITDQEKVYETTSFDHGFPPAEIEVLITKITSFGKQE